MCVYIYIYICYTYISLSLYSSGGSTRTGQLPNAEKQRLDLHTILYYTILYYTIISYHMI